MDHDDVLVIQVPSTVLNPTLDRRRRASCDAKIRDKFSTGTAAVRKKQPFHDRVAKGQADLKRLFASANPADIGTEWRVPDERGAEADVHLR
jgi:hypothetical protein